MRTIISIDLIVITFYFILQEYQFYHKSVGGGGVSTACWIWFSIIFFSLVAFFLLGIYFIEEQHELPPPTVESTTETSGDLFERSTTDDPTNIGFFDLD